MPREDRSEALHTFGYGVWRGAQGLTFMLKRNVAANYLGHLWPPLMNFLFIPLYVKFLGMEAFGLIGVFTTIISMVSLLDFGLSSCLNREMARLSLLPDSTNEMNRVAGTLEYLYWGIGLLVSGLLVIASPILSSRWFTIHDLSTETTTLSFQLMGAALFFRWPHAYYAGGLLGLQRFVPLNAIRIVGETIRCGGAVLVLWLYSSTILTFFCWHVLCNLMQVVLYRFSFWRSIGFSTGKHGFDLSTLRSVWQYALGMTSISFLSVIAMQLDKVVLSRMLPLKEFGGYMLATTLALGTQQIINPIVSAVFPRITQLVATQDRDGLEQLYHRSALLISILIFPISIIFVQYGKDVLMLWTRNTEAVESSFRVLQVYAIGTAVNAMMFLPFVLQQAYGWLSLAFYGSIVSVLLLAPLLIVTTTYWGAVGAAASWVFLCICQFVFATHFFHRRFLQGCKWPWLINDIGKPLLVAILSLGASQFLFGFLKQHGNAGVALFLGISYFFTCAVCVATFKDTRDLLSSLLSQSRQALEKSAEA